MPRDDVVPRDHTVSRDDMMSRDRMMPRDAVMSLRLRATDTQTLTLALLDPSDTARYIMQKTVCRLFEALYDGHIGHTNTVCGHVLSMSEINVTRGVPKSPLSSCLLRTVRLSYDVGEG